MYIVETLLLKGRAFTFHNIQTIGEVLRQTFWTFYHRNMPIVEKLCSKSWGFTPHNKMNNRPSPR